MKDVATLLAAADALHASGEEGVFVTLVRTVGSTYRRAGARMLVMPGCRTVGMISGGCLENAVARDAWTATRNTPKAILEVESAPEDDSWGPASGCHGRLYLLVERIEAGTKHTALETLANVRTSQCATVLRHLFVMTPDGGMRVFDGAVDNRWENEAAVTLANAASRWVEHDGIAAFLEYVAPPIHVLICGAGDDAVPLAKIASELAWTVDVIDTRTRMATRERFAMAQHVQPMGADRLAELLHPHTAVVLMTHRFVDDVDYLAAVMGVNEGPAYIGILGPRARTERLLAELDVRGVKIGARQLQGVRSPVGLDLGSNSPETIALSIAAEIQAAVMGRDGRPLSQRMGALEVGRVVEA